MGSDMNTLKTLIVGLLTFALTLLAVVVKGLFSGLSEPTDNKKAKEGTGVYYDVENNQYTTYTDNSDNFMKM